MNFALAKTAAGNQMETIALARRYRQLPRRDGQRADPSARMPAADRRV
jgi:hypothetical protein